jgi:uncharacterized phiE125 gp8 family phage protein
METTTSQRPIMQVSKTASTTLPISVADAKRHLHIEQIETYYNDQIEDYINAAREYVEDFTNLTLFNTNITAKWNRFPASVVEPLRLPAWPVSSITSIAYRDEDGTAQSIVPASGVQSSLASVPAFILPLPDSEWPETQVDRVDAVTVVFVAGYGTTSATVPHRIKQAVKLLVAHWFKNREAVLTATISKEIELAVHSLLNQIRVNEFTEFERQ